MNKNKSNSRLSIILMPAYFICVLLITYSLPNNVLVSYNILGDIIHWGELLIPSIDNFGNRSSFPQIAQLVFLLELITIPFLTIAAFKETKPRGTLPLPLLAGALIMLIAFLYAYIFWLPGDGMGSSFASKISRGMMDSKFTFVFFTSVFSFALAGIIGAFIKNISDKMT